MSVTDSCRQTDRNQKSWCTLGSDRNKNGNQFMTGWPDRVRGHAGQSVGQESGNKRWKVTAASCHLTWIAGPESISLGWWSSSKLSSWWQFSTLERSKQQRSALVELKRVEMSCIHYWGQLCVFVFVFLFVLKSMMIARVFFSITISFVGMLASRKCVRLQSSRPH